MNIQAFVNVMMQKSTLEEINVSNYDELFTPTD